MRIESDTSPLPSFASRSFRNLPTKSRTAFVDVRLDNDATGYLCADRDTLLRPFQQSHQLQRCVVDVDDDRNKRLHQPFSSRKLVMGSGPGEDSASDGDW